MVEEKMWPIAKALGIAENPAVGMWILYFVIIALCVIVFKLGFAQKLSFKRNVVIYFFVAAGSTVLTFLGVFLPIAEGLLVATGILVLYKIRLWRFKNEEGYSKGVE